MLLETIFNDLYGLGRSIDSVFGAYVPQKYRTNKWPETSVYETNDDYIVISKIPGLDKSQVNISYKDNSLKISGERTKENTENKNLLIDERFSGKFERSFYINDKIDADKITALMNNGLLTVKLPKVPETKAKNIIIN